MRITLIAAMAENRVIGMENRLPWRLPADLKRFKRLTTGKPVIMGRRTWESLPHALPDRKNIVVTRDESYRAEDAVVAGSVVEAIAEAGDVDEVVVIGGADLYTQFLPRADRLYLTLVHADVEGDVLFPEYDPEEWIEKSRKPQPADEKHDYPYTFLRLDRKKVEKLPDGL